ncbi:hypothetical protein LRS10_04165 [Phenylobacterium sp. J426]|uniref:hypothetical protein n=1 Tax=Phenylobacterium sp. J426 TaxID=2898439 RepID=UPI002150C674|nr:hypothetical protein [Phenylobacterium sp. J426]MCR5873453.1 hypothetical protein [Phenylobacterium sp. J426]
MIPPDLVTLDAQDGLPALADAEIALLRAQTAVPPAAERLADFVLSSLDRRHAMAASG